MFLLTLEDSPRKVGGKLTNWPKFPGAKLLLISGRVLILEIYMHLFGFVFW